MSVEQAVSVIFHGQMRFALFFCFFMVRCDLRCLSTSRWCCDSNKLQEMIFGHLEMLLPSSSGRQNLINGKIISLAFSKEENSAIVSQQVL